MARITEEKRRRALRNSIITGALTVGLYLAVFLNQQTVMTYFTKGGLNAILPIATAFLVSFLHGAFTGNFWSALGIEASRKAIQVKVPATKPAKRCGRGLA